MIKDDDFNRLKRIVLENELRVNSIENKLQKLINKVSRIIDLE